MTALDNDPWRSSADTMPGPLAAADTVAAGAAPAALLLCSFCGAENHSSARRCGFCHIDFRDLGPRKWADSHPAVTVGPRSPRPDDYCPSHYGIDVIDDESGAIALTDDPRRALAALHAYYRTTGGDRLAEWGVDPARGLRSGWLHMEDRPDGAWHFWHTDREHDIDVPAISIDL